jgi:hypothetical protein
VNTTDSKLRTPEEWCKLTGTRILDPDGWRMRDAPPWEYPISELEFHWRAGMSTVSIANPARARIVWRDSAPDADESEDCA